MLVTGKRWISQLEPEWVDYFPCFTVRIFYCLGKINRSQEPKSCWEKAECLEILSFLVPKYRKCHRLSCWDVNHWYGLLGSLFWRRNLFTVITVNSNLFKVCFWSNFRLRGKLQNGTEFLHIPHLSSSNVDIWYNWKNDQKQESDIAAGLLTKLPAFFEFYQFFH